MNPVPTEVESRQCLYFLNPSKSFHLGLIIGSEVASCIYWYGPALLLSGLPSLILERW